MSPFDQASTERPVSVQNIARRGECCKPHGEAAGASPADAEITAARREARSFPAVIVPKFQPKWRSEPTSDVSPELLAS